MLVKIDKDVRVFFLLLRISFTMNAKISHNCLKS